MPRKYYLLKDQWSCQLHIKTHSYKWVPNRDSWILDPTTQKDAILPIAGYESVTICCLKTPGETSETAFLKM